MKIVLLVSLAQFLVANSTQAFSLLGPYADWMQPTNGFRYAADIGGPMNLGEEYRWNVPVLTYAFDQSFLDYFGPNGVAAVEQAIQMLNDLPPASQLDPANYPPAALSFNFAAQALGLVDLKSQTLRLLLEQLGLAEPTRYLFCLQNYTFSGGTIQPTMLQRNFDPVNYSPATAVNDSEYSYSLYPYTNGLQIFAIPQPFVLDPLDPLAPAIADGALTTGGFYTGLTRDDVGGLRYLLNTNNTNPEILLPGVQGVGSNVVIYSNQAPRQGVNKITFVRPNYDALLGLFFAPFTNQFTDRYITNNAVVAQQVERVTAQPDLLFSAADPGQNIYGLPYVARTSTSNWWNSASTPGINGPGIIRPQVRLIFSKVGPTVQTYDLMPEGYFELNTQRWGSYDGSANQPVTYPSGSFAGGVTSVRLQLLNGSEIAGVVAWEVPVSLGATITLQTSTNLLDWVSLPTLANQGTVVQWFHSCSRSQRYFRIVPQ